ncbi:hypothetical protein LSCM1_05318 [Leishmania martiniquensis]|uniref:Knr4/Smi1-like domain-containing protein n=1 Tax=Leishmania martiniquensis TaxID=1580590 RepID=A0A836GNB5_9TRYP|nr:hypothetical protein LSCM1_05318 [Leishmania martiniquensis]
MPRGPRTAEVSRRLVDAYVTALRQHLPTHCIRQLDKLPSAQEHQLTRLRQSYPGTPAELLYLLQRVNGTCWETLQAPPASVPPAAVVAPSPLVSASTTTAAKGGSTTSSTLTDPAATSPWPPAAAGTAAATTTTTGLSQAGASSPALTNKTATPVSAVAGAAAKSAAKATAAAAMASEAAAFIKSRIAKKVSTMAGPRQSRPLPHFVALPILGSTYTSCPYYLKSVEQMLLAEQQFPPPNATLPDEGEVWAPPPADARASLPLPLSPTTPKPTAPMATDPVGGGPSSAAATVSDSPLPAASDAARNTHTIASVYAGCKIVYGAPPPSPPPSSPPSSSSASNTAAAPRAAAGEIAASIATTPTSPSEDPRVVYVDPRIDIHASFHQWLVFADSVQPHVRGSASKMPDADPAKMAAAYATGNTADDSRLSPSRAPSQTYTPPPPPKQFAASRLYIDFQPVELQGGVYGQVIQFIHGRPDSFSVVADDFGEYLKYIMSEEYGFTEELEEEDDEEEEEDDDDDAPQGGLIKSTLAGTTPPIITTTDDRPLTSQTAPPADS